MAVGLTSTGGGDIVDCDAMPLNVCRLFELATTDEEVASCLLAVTIVGAFTGWLFCAGLFVNLGCWVDDVGGVGGIELLLLSFFLGDVWTSFNMPSTFIGFFRSSSCYQIERHGFIKTMAGK